VLAHRLAHPITQIGTNYFQRPTPQHLFLESAPTASGVAPGAAAPDAAHRHADRDRGGGVAVLVLPGDISGEAAPHPTGTATWSRQRRSPSPTRQGAGPRRLVNRPRHG